jgi:carbamoyl-phosphate synthase large subunit
MESVMGASSFKSYRDLEVWQLAVVLAKQVYESTAAFPNNERFGLTN